MGDREYRVSKLKLRLDLRQLLDGYESVEARQRKRTRDRDFDGGYGREYEDLVDIAKRMASRPIINKAEATAMSDSSQYTNNLQGANIANFANEVKDNARQQTNQHIHQAANQNLTEAAKEIKDLLEHSIATTIAPPPPAKP
jgi:internalin A